MHYLVKTRTKIDMSAVLRSRRNDFWSKQIENMHLQTNICKFMNPSQSIRNVYFLLAASVHRDMLANLID